MAEQKHYNSSPDMISIETRCSYHTTEELRSMSIERRFSEDNRVPTWSLGMQNFAFDENFLHRGGEINLTDHRVVTIVDKNQNEKDEDVGTRNISENGAHFKPEIEEG